MRHGSPVRAVDRAPRPAGHSRNGGLPVRSVRNRATRRSARALRRTRSLGIPRSPNGRSDDSAPIRLRIRLHRGAGRRTTGAHMAFHRHRRTHGDSLSGVRSRQTVPRRKGPYPPRRTHLGNRPRRARNTACGFRRRGHLLMRAATGPAANRSSDRSTRGRNGRAVRMRNGRTRDPSIRRNNLGRKPPVGPFDTRAERTGCADAERTNPGPEHPTQQLRPQTARRTVRHAGGTDGLCGCGPDEPGIRASDATAAGSLIRAQQNDGRKSDDDGSHGRIRSSARCASSGKTAAHAAHATGTDPKRTRAGTVAQSRRKTGVRPLRRRGSRAVQTRPAHTKIAPPPVFCRQIVIFASVKNCNPDAFRQNRWHD